MNFNKEAVNQYNRNRSAEDQITSIEDIIK